MRAALILASGLLLACSGIGRAQTAAKLAVDPLFSDHMVLQRDKPVPVWGTGAPKTAVTVTFGAQTKSTTTDERGTWGVTLDALPLAKQPAEMLVRAPSESESVTISDVLVGDVYLCGGQSNMALTMKECGRPTDIETATFPLIRQYANLTTRTWVPCAPQSVPDFTAAGFYFARKVHRETGAPIGLIANAIGSSRLERWIPEEGLEHVPGPKPRQERWTHFHGLNTKRLVPFAIRGMIWYQGEQNNWRQDNEGNYVEKMRGLILGLRTAWKQGDFPVYFVQLPSMGVDGDVTAPADKWLQVQLAQFRSLAIPNTGMVVSLDLNEAASIHPANKLDVGERLALWALARDYGRKELVCSGPLYKGMTIDGSSIRVTFDHVGKGLMVGRKQGYEPVREDSAGSLATFAIAEEDPAAAGGRTSLRWVPARAVIEGDTVVVSSPDVAKPVAVRYAYTSKSQRANLYNKDGLPASPFRTNDRDTGGQR